MSEMKKIPVILNTDIGGDIDDTWALALLLRCPELDLKLVVPCLENPDYPFGRTKVAAKQIEQSGYTNIPVAAGLASENFDYHLREWAEDYDLSKYPGGFSEDGIQAMIDTIMASDEIVTVICIGPLTDIAEMVRREPRVAEKAKIIMIGGSIYNGHGLDVIQKASDYNVRADIPSVREVFNAPWDITMIPLDVTAHIVVGDDCYQRILSHRNDDALVGTTLENFDFWMVKGNCTYYKTHTTSLYDTAAIYYAVMGDYNFIVEDHMLSVDDGGYTNDDAENGRLVHCTVYYKYKDMFYKFITDRICGGK